MKNTARLYGSPPKGAQLLDSRGTAAPPPYKAVTSGHPGDTKKQKQLRKTKEAVIARQSELSTLVGRLEDRDTQQQAFTSLLELLPQLDGTLVTDLHGRVERNKNPGRSSTRRMFVLLLAAIAKCHPATAARLLPRTLAYVTLRLRDKEVQITDACAILCSAIALYVVPQACVNSKGGLSPRKKRVSEIDGVGPGVVSTASTDNEDPSFSTFDSVITHLSKETNAVGEHATKCIARIIHPTEFDGVTDPPVDVVGPHGKRVAGYVHVLIQSLVSKMNASTQYAGFSPTFLLLQSVLTLTKVLKVRCDDHRVYTIVLPHLGSLVDAIEDVFRDGPRDDWTLRRRGIELLIQLIEVFACGEAAEDNAGRHYFDENLERIRRLVTEARHDPVSAVRDAALPAVFLFDKLVRMFPRDGVMPAPSSPFKRVYSARGNSRNGASMKGFTTDNYHPTSATQAKEINGKGSVTNPENEVDQEMNFTDSHGDESAGPIVREDADDTSEKHEASVPPLMLDLNGTKMKSPTAMRQALTIKKHETVTTKQSRQKITIPSIAKPKVAPVVRPAVPFQPPDDSEDPFPEDCGDEICAEDSSSDHAIAEQPLITEDRVHAHAQTDTNQAIENSAELPPMTQAEAAIVAAVEGETELALRLCFLQDDMTLLKRVLSLTHDPDMPSLSRASRTALCAAFLELLDFDGDEDELPDDAWVAFLWLQNISRHPRLVQQLDPRVLRALEMRLNCIAEQPTRAGLVAADILTAMGYTK